MTYSEIIVIYTHIYIYIHVHNIYIYPLKPFLFRFVVLTCADRYYAKEISTEIPELELDSLDAGWKHLGTFQGLETMGKVGGNDGQTWDDFFEEFWRILQEFWLILQDFWLILENFWMILDDVWMIM